MSLSHLSDRYCDRRRAEKHEALRCEVEQVRDRDERLIDAWCRSVIEGTAESHAALAEAGRG